MLYALTRCKDVPTEGGQHNFTDFCSITLCELTFFLPFYTFCTFPMFQYYHL